jgi:hypothetical protein
VSSITTQGFYLFDKISNSNVTLAINNNTLLVGGSQIQSGGISTGNFYPSILYSSFSTVFTYTSSIQIGPATSAFAPSGQYSFDCIGSGRFTQLVSTAQIIVGSQYVGLQFG